MKKCSSFDVEVKKIMLFVSKESTLQKKENLQPIEIQSVGDLLGDPYRIQTCNLLIRSQILYSVELTGHSRFCFYVFVTRTGFKPVTF